MLEMLGVYGSVRDCERGLKMTWASKVARKLALSGILTVITGLRVNLISDKSRNEAPEPKEASNRTERQLPLRSRKVAVEAAASAAAAVTVGVLLSNNLRVLVGSANYESSRVTNRSPWLCRSNSVCINGTYSRLEILRIVRLEVSADAWERPVLHGRGKASTRKTTRPCFTGRPQNHIRPSGGNGQIRVADKTWSAFKTRKTCMVSSSAKRYLGRIKQADERSIGRWESYRFIRETLGKKMSENEDMYR